MMPHAASQDALRIGHGQVIYTCQRNDICGGPPDEIKAACLSASWPLFYSAQALAVSALGNSMTEIQCANGVPPGVPSTRFVVTPVATSRREPANGRCSLRYLQPVKKRQTGVVHCRGGGVWFGGTTMLARPL